MTEKVERVRSLVHQHAAALALPRAAPARRPVIAVRAIERIDDRHADQLADPPGRDQPARGGDDRPEALLEADAEQAAGVVRRGDHRVRLAYLHGERFLDEHVRACRECLDRQRWMGQMRRRDDRDVKAEPEQLGVVRERPRARVLASKCAPSGALIPTSSTSSSAAIPSRCIGTTTPAPRIP